MRVASHLGGLWRDRDFQRLWFGQSVSVLGDQITLIALPLTAVIVLDANATEMGLLRALEQSPILLFSLFVGVWLDRVRRRPLLIAADLGRAALVATIPLAAVLGVLRLELLYLVAFPVGCLALIFEVGYRSYLPSLVRREQLVDANGKLNMSVTAAQVIGPAISGVLVAVFTAPLPLVLDAASFLTSAASLRLIRQPESAPKPAADRNVLAEIREGLAALVEQPILRALLVSVSIALLSWFAMTAILVLFMVTALGLDPAAIGLVFGLGSVGGLAGAALAAPLTRRAGFGVAIISANALFVIGSFLIALTPGSMVLTVPMLTAALTLVFFGASIYNVSALSLRQALTPPRLLGRVNASYRFIAWGTTPIGALLGGVLGELLGLRTTLLLGAVGIGLALVWVLVSPLRSFREVPTAGP